MKHLKFSSILQGTLNTDNVLYSNGLTNFINDLTRELLFKDTVDMNEDFYFDIDNFPNSIDAKYYFTVGLTDGIYLKIESNITANKCELSDRFEKIEIDVLILNLQDGSEIEIDLSKESGNNDIAEYIIKNVIL